MARKDLVRPDFGKKKMLRENVPEHRKYVAKTNNVKKDLDLIKYLGDDLDFSQIPEVTEKEKREKEEIERLESLAQTQSDSDGF